MRIQFQDITAEEFATMHEGILRLLSEYGVLFEHDEAVRLLTEAGNELGSDGRVHLKPAFVEKMLGLVPKDGFTLYGRDESRILRAAVDEIAFRPSTGTPFIVDYGTTTYRDATMEDARVMTLVADALDGVGMVNCAVNPAGAPHGEGTLRLFATSHRYSQKPSDVTVMTRQEVEGIARIGAAIRGSAEKLREKPLTEIDVAMITPLRCAGEQVEALLECAKWGIPIELLTSPAMGLTSPITLAGSAVVNIAEMIAALCLVYTVSPGHGMTNTSRVTSVNMRTTAYNSSGPELGMASLLVTLCCERYNIPTDSYGFGTTARFPGIQAAMDKMSNGMLMSLGKPFMVTGGGMLGNSLATSPEQLVIDNEAFRQIKHMRRRIAIDEDALGFDALKSGMAESGCLLMEEHTIRNLKAGEIMECGIGQWGAECLSDPDGMLKQAHAKVEEILSTHEVEPFDPALEREIERIISSTEMVSV